MRMRSLNSWFLRPNPAPQASLRLFCFPYAGGNPSVFFPWARSMPRNIELWTIQLPGHGERLAEKPYSHIEPLVQDLAAAILPYLDQPFAFFGHSMGATVAFELARRLHRQGDPEPSNLIVSAQKAPQSPHRHPITHDLPKNEFIDELRRLNGTPAEVFSHAELLELLLPVLRADFAVCETYTYQDGPTLNCPVTAFGGLADPDIERYELEAWREQTCGRFRLRMFPGDHFFLNSSQALVLQMLLRDLEHYATRFAA